MKFLAGKKCVLMVSGGSDSTALLEMAARLEGREQFSVLHVHHGLRGADADADRTFVRERCEALGLPFHCEQVDVAALAASTRMSTEEAARTLRYEAAERVAGDGLIVTAHTLDDRVETFFMRALVGTGPAGLASIPRQRGNIYRPLLGHTREELRDYLRKLYPGTPDEALWREDSTNYDGSNFRSRLRAELIPAARALRPGFERSLQRTMDLIEDEQAALLSEAHSIVLRNLHITCLAEDGSVLEATLPVEALTGADLPTRRRILHAALLEISPHARFESQQITRILEALPEGPLNTELTGALRVRLAGPTLTFTKVRL